MRAYSLRLKLLGVVLLTTLAAVVVAIGAMVAYDLHAYHRGWIADMTSQAELLARTSAPALAFNDERYGQENLEVLRFRPEIDAAALYNARGQVFASYSQSPAHELPKLPEADGTRVRGDRLVAFQRVISGKEIVGAVYLSARYELYDRLLGYLGIAAMVVLLSMGVAYGLSLPMQRAVTRPLVAIARVAREVTDKGNFALRAEKLSEDEVGRLADAFNTMLAEIEKATRGLEASNRELEREVAERQLAEGEISRLNTELEERVRERTAQLEHANRELEAFCYSVSHDLRAPLRSIDGFSQALLDDFPRDVPAEAQRYLGRIRSSTQRMGQLIEDLLNLSKVSRSELQLREVDVSELARQVAAELQQREPQRQVALNVWDGMHAQADSRLVRAALENLVGNAWKFTARAAAPAIEVGALRDGGAATFFVRDNGAGFDMKFADKLFGAFQRLHGANEYPGTGIGLATVQRIVGRHGGRVWADAQPGKGAVFFFTLDAGGKQA